ncbi:MAG: M23 family peptidase, partial [Roseiarcus sp.]
MSLRDQRSRPARVKTHFYFSHARGDAIRTVAVRPFVLWSLAAFAALTLVWAGLTTVYLAFHDDMLAALAAREAEQQYAYEDRIAEARAELDRVAGRQLLDQSSFEGKLHELLSRQARLEQRGAIVAALADQTTRSLAA